MGRARLTPLTKGRQITGIERDQIAAQLKDRYAQGASIRDLMAQTGRSYGWTHRLLRESGAVLRGRGGAHPPRDADLTPTAGPPG
ncbi:MAG: helix-turn-helix domain-containing protein [Pseudonocardiaceae bacterium]